VSPGAPGVFPHLLEGSPEQTFSHMEPVCIDAVLKDWEARGYSGGVWTDPPGQKWENFCHDVDELLMVVTGEIELEMDGETRLLRPGEEATIAARAVHSVRNSGDSEARWLYAYGYGA
jgi:quercetin dioxygenase-like cupin family protein